MYGDSTAWYASKTIWASIIGILVPLAGVIFHVTVNAGDAQDIAVYLAAAGSAVAALAAIYGRIKASKPITGSQAAAAIQPQAKGK